MRGHMGCGGLSRSRCLSVSSLPLEPRRAYYHAWAIWNPHRPTNLSGTSQGPLVWFSIRACVEMVAKTGKRMVVFRKMSGRGAGCVDPGSPAATDDHGLVLYKVKVVTVPTPPAFPGRELMISARSRTVRVVNIVHPCRV